MKLGRFRLLRRIAVGGMAELFAAHDEERGQSVVVKVILPQHARDPEFVQMLHDEARLASRLDHPNLVRVLEHGTEGEQHYLVMEYVEGPNLAALLGAARQAGRPPPAQVALEVGRQLLEALRYLHGFTDPQGTPLEVVHRDVTPSNVLLQAGTGQLKLGDFGIARHRLRGSRTRTGVIKGTVQYMAPEQVTGSGVDARTDLYGVGLILFELLTLRPFVYAEREVELLRLAEAPPWVPPSSLRSELPLPGELDRLVQRGLHRFPEERYVSAQSFLDVVNGALSRLDPPELKSWVEGLPGAEGGAVAVQTPAAPGKPATRVAPTVPAPGRVRMLLWSLLLALPVVGLGVVGLLLLTPGDAPAPAERPDAASPLPDARPLPADQRISDRTVAAADLGRPDQRPRQPRRTHRRPPRPSRPVSPDAAPALPAAARRPALLARLRAAREALARRGILLEDLRPALRDRLARVEQQVHTGDPTAAGNEVDALGAELLRLRVDRALVEAKLRRVDARLKRGGSKVPGRLRERAGQALQEFMDGRYAAANRQLNRIIEGLGQ